MNHSKYINPDPQDDLQSVIAQRQEMAQEDLKLVQMDLDSLAKEKERLEARKARAEQSLAYWALMRVKASKLEAQEGPSVFVTDGVTLSGTTTSVNASINHTLRPNGNPPKTQ